MLQKSAGDRGRTGTGITTHGILSPGRLPIPPRRHVLPEPPSATIAELYCHRSLLAQNLKPRLQILLIGSEGGARTHNLSVNSRLLYH